MSVTVHPGRLAHEIARRGWAPIDLAREARISPATVSAALSGRPIAARTLGLIAAALLRTPPVAEIDRLLLNDGGLDLR
jgi:lambda repressor-like predicted transcriptional regulator